MKKAKEAPLPQPELETAKKAGDVQTFPTGKVTFIAPLPLPTFDGPYGPHIGELNDVYMDFGTGKPNVFSWQVNLGGPFNGFLMFAFYCPIIMGIIALLQGESWAGTWELIIEIYLAALELAIWSGLGALAMSIGLWHEHHQKYRTVTPTRFNRQRREVCFVPNRQTEAVFFKWETVVAWMIEAKGVSQYGVVSQYGMGLGFQHEVTGERYIREFICAGPLALAHWEAIRGYMEYEIHDLKTIHANSDLQGPDDPPHEGMHTFRNARARLHRQVRDKESGYIYAFFWYFYHVMTLWTLPFWVTDWENRKIQRMGRAALPEVMRDWSEPLPPEQWAKPSEKLLRMSEQVRVLHRRYPRQPITEIYAEVYRMAENQ